MKVTLKTSEAARREAAQLFSEISTLVSDLENGKLFVNLNDSSYVASKSDCLRIASQVLSTGPLKNMLLRCMVDAESTSAGGSFVMLKFLSLKDKNSFIESIKNRRFSLLELEKSMSSASDEKSAKVVIESLKRAGRDGKIVLDKSDSTKTEIVFGSQQCSWHPSIDFFSSLKSSKASVNYPKLVFIDGIIESVSECHKIFQDSNENLTPYLIFARGFSNDVVTTSAVNFQRNTAQVIPIEVPYDEVGCNALVDLATGFGTDVVSSLKGELISSVDLSQCPKIEKATAFVNFVELESLKNNMSKVVSYLSERIKSSSSAEEEILRKRISSLGAGALTIRVGKDNKSFAGTSRDRIDYCIRYSVASLKSGVCNFHNGVYPFSSIEAGKKASDSFLQVLSKNGAILTEDKLCG